MGNYIIALSRQLLLGKIILQVVVWLFVWLFVLYSSWGKKKAHNILNLRKIAISYLKKKKSLVSEDVVVYTSNVTQSVIFNL